MGVVVWSLITEISLHWGWRLQSATTLAWYVSLLGFEVV